MIDDQTEPWGVKVTAVEVKDVDLPQSMQRAMAMQAEAEREKRAKIIRAEGEFQAAQQLTNAAAVIGREPATLQLRYLQTLAEIGTEQNTVVVFPLPPRSHPALPRDQCQGEFLMAKPVPPHSKPLRTRWPLL